MIITFIIITIIKSNNRNNDNANIKLKYIKLKCT